MEASTTTTTAGSGVGEGDEPPPAVCGTALPLGCVAWAWVRACWVWPWPCAACPARGGPPALAFNRGDLTPTPSRASTAKMRSRSEARATARPTRASTALVRSVMDRGGARACAKARRRCAGDPGRARVDEDEDVVVVVVVLLLCCAEGRECALALGRPGIGDAGFGACGPRCAGVCGVDS